MAPARASDCDPCVMGETIGTHEGKIGGLDTRVGQTEKNIEGLYGRVGAVERQQSAWKGGLVMLVFGSGCVSQIVTYFIIKALGG